jgi:hypothetical protein
MAISEITSRVQELRAQGLTRQQATEKAYREAVDAQTAAWRAQDSER